MSHDDDAYVTGCRPLSEINTASKSTATQVSQNGVLLHFLTWLLQHVEDRKNHELDGSDNWKALIVHYILVSSTASFGIDYKFTQALPSNRQNMTEQPGQVDQNQMTCGSWIYIREAAHLSQKSPNSVLSSMGNTKGKAGDGDHQSQAYMGKSNEPPIKYAYTNLFLRHGTQDSESRRSNLYFA